MRIGKCLCDSAQLVSSSTFTFETVVSSVAFFEYKDDGAFPKPPSYNVATTLPSYDEAERSKAETTVPLVTGRVSIFLLPFFGYFQFCTAYTRTHTHALCTRRGGSAHNARWKVLLVIVIRACFIIFLREFLISLNRWVEQQLKTSTMTHINNIIAGRISVISLSFTVFL